MIIKISTKNYCNIAMQNQTEILSISTNEVLIKLNKFIQNEKMTKEELEYFKIIINKLIQIYENFVNLYEFFEENKEKKENKEYWPSLDLYSNTSLYLSNTSLYLQYLNHFFEEQEILLSKDAINYLLFINIFPLKNILHLKYDTYSEALIKTAFENQNRYNQQNLIDINEYQKTREDNIQNIKNYFSPRINEIFCRNNITNQNKLLTYILNKFLLTNDTLELNLLNLLTGNYYQYNCLELLESLESSSSISEDKIMQLYRILVLISIIGQKLDEQFNSEKIDEKYRFRYFGTSWEKIKQNLIEWRENYEYSKQESLIIQLVIGIFNIF